MKYKSIFLRLLVFACVVNLLVKVRKSMAKRLTFTVMLSAAIISGTLASCQYKDFDGYDGNVTTMIVMDWSALDSADSRPEVMKAVFYPVGSAMRPFSVTVKDSAMVSIPMGQYRVFACNDDSRILRFGGTDNGYGMPIVYTDKADRHGLPDGGDFYDYPDRTYVSYIGTAVSNFTGSRIVLRPMEVTQDVEVIVDGIKGQDDIYSVRMSLDGACNSFSPVMTAEKNYVTVVSDGIMRPSEDRITSSLHVYSMDRNEHTLQLFITGRGFRKILTFDVTGQVNSQADGTMGKITIHVRADYDAGDDVPVDATGGMGVGVDDWPAEDIPVSM